MANGDNTNMSFREAFRSARDAGQKTFMWNGKSYNTKLRNGEDKQEMVVQNAFKYIDNYDEAAMSDPMSVPQGLLPAIDMKLRKNRNLYDQLGNEEGKYDKASQEHLYIKTEKEKIGKSFININNNKEKLKLGIGSFKAGLGNMNPGTDPYNLSVNSAVYGNGHDGMHIDDNGNFHFLLSPVEISDERARQKFIETGEWNEDYAEIIGLNDMGDYTILL